MLTIYKHGLEHLTVNHDSLFRNYKNSYRLVRDLRGKIRVLIFGHLNDVVVRRTWLTSQV